MHENIESFPKQGRDDISEPPALQFLDFLPKIDNKLTSTRNLQADIAQSETAKPDKQYLTIPPLHLEANQLANNSAATAASVAQKQGAEIGSAKQDTSPSAKPDIPDSAKSETSRSKRPDEAVAAQTPPEQATSAIKTDIKAAETETETDKSAKAAESIKLQVGTDGKIELSEKDFDLVGPRAKKALTDAGVTKISITPHDGFDSYHFELKQPQEVEQDPSIDGTRKLKIGTELNFDLKHNSDGSLSISNIEGLTAESNILRKFRDAEVQKIRIEKTEDGESKISSTGSWNGFSRTKVRTEPGEAFDTANLLFERMQKLKGSSNN